MAAGQGRLKTVLLFLLIKLTNSEPCGLCSCWFPTGENSTVAFDCSNRSISLVPEWPLHEHIVATFAQNNIEKLQKLPPSNASISISFKNCSIKDLDSDIFMDVNVVYIDLSWNHLEYETIHPEVFRNPNNEKNELGLSELNLAYNKINSLDTKIFEYVPNITVLDLSGNPFGIIDATTWFAVNQLSLLRSLNLSNCGITKIEDGINGLPNTMTLTMIDLSNNHLETVPGIGSTLPVTLQKVILDGNLMTEINDQCFLGLKNLRDLRLSNMKNLHTIKHNSFSNLKHLRTLHLSNNPNLAYILENAFGIPEDWPPIIELFINDNHLSELPLLLLNWRRITETKLYGNNWACPCVKLPCICTDTKIARMDTEPEEEPKKSWGITKTFLLIIPIVLCFVAGIFCWRILIKYRGHRAVNSMFPVMYQSAPTHIH